MIEPGEEAKSVLGGHFERAVFQRFESDGRAVVWVVCHRRDGSVIRGCGWEPGGAVAAAKDVMSREGAPAPRP